MFAAVASATVANTPFTVSFTCTGGYGPFPFNFSVSSASAITVTMNGTLLAVGNYSVVPINNNYDNGGKVTLGSLYPCNAGWPLVLTRVTPITQTIAFYAGMPTPTVQFENGLDKLTEIAQEISAHSTLPDPTGHNGEYLGSNGGPLYVLSVPPGGGNVVGPGSSVANDIAGYTDTTGSLLKDVGISYTVLPTMASAAAGAGNIITSAGADRTQQDSGVPLSSFGLPAQTGNAGKVLTTNATLASWAAGLPVYTPHQLALNCTGSDEGSAIQSAINAVASGGGGIIQNQAGDNCNAGTTAITWPTTKVVIWRGTGYDYNGQWGTTTSASSSLTVGCTDSYGCIKFEGTIQAGIEDLAIRNSSTCSAFVYNTATTLILRASFRGKQGSQTTVDACNDAVVLAHQVSCPGSGEAVCFSGYGSSFVIYTDKIRRAAVLGSTAAETTWWIYGNSTDSNSTVDTDGSGLGPFVDLQGYSGNMAIQNTFYYVYAEMGSAASHTGSSHFNSAIRYDYAGGNQALAVIGDDAASTPEPTALILSTSNAVNNYSVAQYYFSSGPYAFPAISDANPGCANTYFDVPNAKMYLCTLVAPNLGTSTIPVNTVKYGLYTVATLPSSPHAPQTAWVSDGASSTDCTTGLGSTVVQCKYVGGAWSALGSGTGTVTTFSAGTLSPLFTTSVANPTTAPALSFALSNAAANTVFGNFTGSSGAPSYNAVSPCGDPTHALGWTAGTGFACQSITGNTVSVNGSPITNPNFNDTTTAAPANGYNVKLQCTGSNCSAYVGDYGTIGFEFKEQSAPSIAYQYTGMKVAATLPANFASPLTWCTCATPPSGSFAITVKNGSTTVGTLTLDNACHLTAVTVGGTSKSFVAQDKLYLYFPADASIVDADCMVMMGRN